ncbi:MAG: DEAD/DEAH box helicase [Steroidobacteraceae bacterium]
MIEPASDTAQPAELPMVVDGPAEISAGAPDAEPRPVMAGVHLLFIPDGVQSHWLLWGSEAAQSPLAVLGEPGTHIIPDEAFKLRRVRGYRLPLLEGAVQLAALTQGELPQLPPSVAVWSLAAKLGLELVAREQLLPRIVKQAEQQVARWTVVLNLPADAQRMAALAQAFPVAAHAVPLIPTMAVQTAAEAGAPVMVWSAAALLREFLDTLADQLLRAAQPQVKPRRRTARTEVPPVVTKVPWPQRLQSALLGEEAGFVPEGVQERSVLSELRDWLQPVAGAAPPLQLCLQLELPPADSREFTLHFILQKRDDAGVRVSAQELFANGAAAAAHLQCDLRLAQEWLLQMLAVAARSFAFIENELRQPRPVAMQIKPRVVYELLQQLSALEQAGVAVQLPEVLQPATQQRLQMSMRIGVAENAATTATQTLPYRWQVQLAGHLLTTADLDELAELRTPLARFHDQWVILDARELAHAGKLLAQGGGKLGMSLALSLALTEVITQADSTLRIQVIAEGALGELVAQMRERDAIQELPTPTTLRAELRPYQLRGMSWLAHLTHLGLGACLADDMGLGKTVQLLALLLHRQQTQPHDLRPILLVCPTSVIGNWEREIARFAPTLSVLRHYGIQRIQNAEDFQPAAQGQLVIASYGLMRRDIPWLQDIDFAMVALDEAQFIKNSASATARAARTLKASERIALTGTPVENHLAELWSIMEFLNPGLLGPRETFRREIAIPVERYGREDVALRLRRMVAPFILRRVKNDPSIMLDLPAKQETKVFCSLTREQASLYQQAVNESLLEIESSDGIARRGRVLALLTALKQICNHPAHYLREQGPLNGRSGKLDRLLEMLEQVLLANDRALIFTQYREMGERLVRALSRLQGKAVPFLHGGVSRAARDEMVRRFQDEPRASRLLVISLKAGGTGLNLTAATEVFHFDRWWNPAVEDQATDRAYRIGQQRNVQVYKLLCAGTVEEKIDQMLESKRDLAARVVSQGESWITELENHELRELFALAPNAVVADAPDTDEPEERLPERKRKAATS